MSIMSFFKKGKNYNQLLEEKKQELISLNVNANDINTFMEIGKKNIEQSENNLQFKLESLKSLIIKLQDLRELGYEDGDINYLFSEGLDYINKIGNEVLSPDDFDTIYSDQLRNPKESKKEILMNRLTPEEYLKRILENLKKLGYSDEDIEELRKRGLDIIKENKDYKVSHINWELDTSFVYEFTNPDYCKRKMAEERAPSYDELEKLLEEKKQELIGLNVNANDINTFMAIGKKSIKQPEKNSKSKLESLKSLMIKLQDLRKLGYEDDDINYLVNSGVEYINAINGKLSPDDFNNVYRVQLWMPEEAKRTVLKNRLTPKEYLERILESLKKLGYSDEDIKELRKRGLDVIKSYKDRDTYSVNNSIETKFANEFKNPEKCKKQMAEDRETYVEVENKLLKKLEEAGYGELKIRKIKKEIDNDIEKLKADNKNDDIIKKEVKSKLERYNSNVKNEKNNLKMRFKLMNESEPNKAYSSIYGKKIASYLKDRQLVYEVYKFEILTLGQPIFNKFRAATHDYLKASGYDESVISKTVSTLKNASSDPETVIKEIDEKVSQLVSENRRYIELFENYKGLLVLPANLYYGNKNGGNEIKLIQEFLRKNSEDKNKLIDLLNEKLKDYYVYSKKNSDGRSVMDILATNEKEKEMFQGVWCDFEYNKMFSKLIMSMNAAEQAKEELMRMVKESGEDKAAEDKAAELLEELRHMI